MKIVRFIAGVRFFALIPVLGLAIAACILFIEGGIDLVHLLLEMVEKQQKQIQKVLLLLELWRSYISFL